MSEQQPLFLRALKAEPVEHTPIWIMRQAGRYLPEYRALREKHSFMEMCHTPELAAEVTLQPIRRYGLDAAIIFSDILLVLDAMGAGVRFEEGGGPVIDKPIKSADDVARLTDVDAERDLPFVADAIRATVSELPAHVPLIGFAGAPWTLLTYFTEGKAERGLVIARSLLLREPEAAHSLLDKLAKADIAQLRAQVQAGARAVQLFDTWASSLPPEMWRRFAAPYAKQVFDGVADLGVPRIYFGRGTASLLPYLTEAGADAYGVDWQCDIGDARRALGPDVAVQGNLDPAVMITSPEVVRAEATTVLEAAAGPGHVFNLGHGVIPQTEPDLVAELVDFVHEHSAKAVE